MALNETKQISKETADLGRVVWSSTASDISWVCVNGQIYFGPIFSDDTIRDTDFELETGDTCQLEIHDFASTDEAGKPINVKANSLPKISWNGISNAARYKLYHRDGYAGTEEELDEILSTGATNYETDCPVILNGNGGVWHWFRVESIDQYGNESTHAIWHFWVYDLPSAISNVTIESGSGAGLFDITLEV